MPGKHSTAAEFDSFVHQLNHDVLALWANCSHIHLDDEFAALQLHLGPCALGPKLGAPRRDQLAFQNQPALAAVLDNGDLQDGSPPLRTCDKGKAHAKPKAL